MREYHFDPTGELPVVPALLKGPKGKIRVALVFDSGCALTQVHHKILEAIGYRNDRRAKKIPSEKVHGTSLLLLRRTGCVVSTFNSDSFLCSKVVH